MWSHFTCQFGCKHKACNFIPVEDVSSLVPSLVEEPENTFTALVVWDQGDTILALESGLKGIS